jgi:predicted PurR-regulated permease PerM
MNASQQDYSLRQFLVSAAAFIIIVVGMQWGASIVLPLVMILYITVLVTPLYEWMLRKGWPKWLAIICVIAFLIGVFVGLFLLVYYSFNRLVGELGDMEGQFKTRLSQLGLQMSADPNASSNTTLKLVFDLFKGFLVAVLGKAINLVAGGAIMLVAVVLILLDSVGIQSTLKRILGEKKSLAGARQLPRNLINYFIARTEVNFLTGSGIAVFLLIMRVDYALLWAVLAFALSYVPYIGLFIAAIPAVVLAFVEYGLTSAIIVSIGYIVLNQVAEVILEPKITGARLSLKPWFVFLSMFAFGWLMGPAGVLLAGPLTVFTVILFSMFGETQWILSLIVTDKTPAEPAEVTVPEETAT